MEKLKQKLTKELVTIVLVCVAALLSMASSLTSTLPKDNPISLKGAGTDVTECFGSGGAATTTGLIVFTVSGTAQNTGTTTVVNTCSINNATDLAFNYIFGATTTESVDFIFQFSHDGGTWFSEGNQTANSNELTTLATGTSTPRRYAHTFNGTTTRQTPLISTASRYMRVLADVNSNAVGTTTAYLWASISKREGLSR